MVPPSPSSSDAELLVACLCAGWCTTCDAYRPVFAASARAHPGVRHVWVDIEDHADAIDDADGDSVDIENFPTLLLMRGEAASFLGTVLPHASVLERLVAEAAQDGLRPVADPATAALARNVRRLARSLPGV